MRPLHFVVVSLLLVVLGRGAALAQSATGEVNGPVQDPTGAVVSGAKVTLTKRGTKSTEVTVSNGSGNFLFINLQPGDYILSAEHAGFKKLTTEPFTLQVNQTITQPVRL